MHVSSSFKSLTFTLSFTLVAFCGVVFTASAAETCTFTKTLEMGVISPEVKCLQEYLNGNGYPLTAVGPGAPGDETDKFGSLTQAAVIKWQRANGVSPTVGIFGPVSQAKYTELVGAAAPSQISSSRDAERLLGLVDQLQKQLSGNQTSDTSNANEPAPQVAGASTDAAKARAESTIKAALRLVLEAQEHIEDEVDEDDRTDLREDLRDATEGLFTALFQYFDERYDRADRTAKNAFDDVKDVLEVADDGYSERDAEDVLDDAWDAYRDAADEIEEADDEGNRSADVARDILDEAKDVLQEAEEAYRDGDYEDAIELAEEAEELIDEALDEL